MIMREILFRGKTQQYTRWIYGDLNHYMCDDGVFIAENGYSMHRVFKETVGQYTGLTDKNGKKIFEGDIVKIEHSDYAFDGMTLEYRKEKGVIAYDNIGSVGLIVGRYKDENVWSDFFNVLGLTDRIESWSFEIIGNIHDNPELLKGGAE